MTVAAIILAYFGIALVCVYLDARLSGSDYIPGLWLMWPLMLPVCAIVVTFEAIGKLGEKHSR